MDSWIYTQVYTTNLSQKSSQFHKLQSTNSNYGDFLTKRANHAVKSELQHY